MHPAGQLAARIYNHPFHPLLVEHHLVVDIHIAGIHHGRRFPVERLRDLAVIVQRRI